MAIEKVTQKGLLTGLSTDDKPTSAPQGMTLHCVDTGEEWVFYDGMWTLDLRRARALLLAGMLA
jgi:hypothetical protein